MSLPAPNAGLEQNFSFSLREVWLGLALIDDLRLDQGTKGSLGPQSALRQPGAGRYNSWI